MRSTNHDLGRNRPSLTAPTIVAALTAVLVCFTASRAQAAVVLNYDLDELAVESDEVVHGQVIAQSSYWEGQVIMTETTVAIVECLKGDHQPGDRIVIRQQGGVVDDLVMLVPGMPTFFDGEEVVLFLEASTVADTSLVMGMQQGAFRVRANPETGERLVVRDLTGLARLDPASGELLETHSVLPSSGDEPGDGRLVRPGEIGAADRTDVLELERPDLDALSLAEQVRAGPVRLPFDGFMNDLRGALVEASR